MHINKKYESFTNSSEIVQRFLLSDFFFKTIEGIDIFDFERYLFPHFGAQIRS